MPGRMGKVPGQFPLAQHTPRGAIHFAGGHARTNRRDGRLLRFQHRLIHLVELPRDGRPTCTVRVRSEQ